MKKILIIALIIWLSGNALLAVNGRIDDLGDRYLLHVWGTHYERGQAMGYLMGEQIMAVFREYFFASAMSNSPAIYNSYLQYYQNHFVVDARYLQEVQGIITGMQESGTDMYHQGLGRDLNVSDLLFVNAVVDLATGQIACSSLSSWGNATLSDPDLQGKLQITRLLDWTRSQTLINNSVLTVHHPSEVDEMPWLSFGYPGLIGALSAINEAQAAVFLNVGNAHPNVDDDELSTVLLDLRSGIERRDFNGDGLYSTEDVFSALFTGNHLSGSIIHNVQEWPDSSRAYIVETNNTGTVRRGQAENSGIAGDNLAATNHFRLLTDAAYCGRYARIADSLAVSDKVDMPRQWQIMKGAGGVSSNLMMIQYIPSQNALLWANATPYYAAYTQEPQYFALDELFTQPTHNLDDTHIQTPELALYPNPLTQDAVLKDSSCAQLKRVRIYNLRGQLLYDEAYLPSAKSLGSSGIYYVHSEDIKGSKYRNKIVYCK
ncbi:MAG: T9SS type A sorting domain-containing protein [Candidatus Cloacimonetes bacterium]|jgi:hypothetical protein|nr:T9SS type A sorting domain-containing protein [Candidatus Cloacimonadota bacterium]MCB5286342.1 T9SS type A sorting domain-containing protein [Candidatus Cloacimonadota bacterium]MCK9184057.1 T9SS type A sorting domain-containing protein [Candidatus Cloacimonadota bacterium]MCK9583741.1 T9SS type A sorting domain-containing protein [Candidatus Cloacimonadota bacterium]MDY0228664.1 T9SS type A sorting domain-containing protein [Candidatus Cloacimonadaceae bacterium]